MAEQIIEVEADSLEDARTQLKARIPVGFHLLSEKIISDGKTLTVKVIADTRQDAFVKAEGQIPPGATVLEKRELISSEQKVIVEAFDEENARREAVQKARSEFGGNATVKSVKLIQEGKKGFLGIGKQPHQYEAELLHDKAAVQITYKIKVRISAKIDGKSVTTSPGSYHCSRCKKKLEEIGIPPNIQLMREITPMFKSVVVARDENVTDEIREDPYVYRGFFCRACKKVFCPSCSHMQGEICPECGQKQLMPAYRPLLKG